MHAPCHDPKPLSRLVSLLLLCGWLLSAHGIAPAICMVAAMIDGDHVVRVGVSSSGAFTVVLSHEGKSDAELMAHEHDTLCRVLVAFAETAVTGTSADHVLAFRSVDDATRAQQGLQVPVLGCARKVFFESNPAGFQPGVTSSAGGAAWQPRRFAWSPGLAMKCGRVVMRC